jgi:hypothetical protein
MHRNGSQARRLPDGSIHYGFYLSAARDERIAAIEKTPSVVVQALRSLVEFWKIPTLGRGIREPFPR